jgi:hypothetical protein
MLKIKITLGMSIFSKKTETELGINYFFGMQT